jgi:hypothetical protein
MAVSGSKSARNRRLREAMEILRVLGFAQRQSNEVAGYVLLSLLDLEAHEPWSASHNPLRGITPMISFIRIRYGVSYAPNTRETIRDEAVKYFVESGMVLRNPDAPERPTNSGKTAYQMEPSALALLRTFGTVAWDAQLKNYLSARDSIRREIERHRTLARIPVKLPSGETVTLSPGGQNPLIKEVIEEFCARFVAGGTVVYIGDTENKFLHLDATYLQGLGVVIAPSAKMPDVVVHDTSRNWLFLIEAVSTAGPVDGKRRKELKQLFQRCRAGLVFVTAFEARAVMQSFLSQISWETEVWIAANPDHLIHFNGDRFLGPYES